MKICIFTLGCKQNEVESASLMRGLADLGHTVTDALGPADLYLLNTCAVTAEAARKSRQAIARMRKFSPAAPVVVFGCAAQENAEEFAERTGVVLVAGAMHKDRLLEFIGPAGAERVGAFAKGVMLEAETEFTELPPPASNKTRAFLRVQDGCDRFCSYCLIPYLRGRSRSRALSSIVAEASALPAKEIVLTGIDLSAWRDGERDLGDLLLALRDLPARVRLGSLEAGIVGKDFLRKMKAAGNVAPHFHLSLQSGSTRVLRAMNRRYTREEYLAVCEEIYAAFPEAAITTDIIVGFPTETEEDFLSSCSIVEEAGFARVHVFPFSPRPGTQAARLVQIAADVKKERAKRLGEVAARAQERYLSRFLGKTLTALFEEDGGYTENYIRVYNETAKEGGMYEVRLTKRHLDGAACDLVSGPLETSPRK